MPQVFLGIRMIVTGTTSAICIVAFYFAKTLDVQTIVAAREFPIILLYKNWHE